MSGLMICGCYQWDQLLVHLTPFRASNLKLAPWLVRQKFQFLELASNNPMVKLQWDSLEAKPQLMPLVSSKIKIWSNVKPLHSTNPKNVKLGFHVVNMIWQSHLQTSLISSIQKLIKLSAMALVYWKKITLTLRQCSSFKREMLRDITEPLEAINLKSKLKD